MPQASHFSTSNKILWTFRIIKLTAHECTPKTQVFLDARICSHPIISTPLNLKRKGINILCCTVSTFVVESTIQTFFSGQPATHVPFVCRFRCTILLQASNCSGYYSQHVRYGAMKWDKLLNRDWLCLNFIWELDVLPMRTPSLSLLLWEWKLFSTLFIGENSAHRAWLWCSFEVPCSSIPANYADQTVSCYFLCVRQCICPYMCGLLNGSDYVTSNGSTIVSYDFECLCEE
jgi:hypothetical protein